MAEPEEGEPEEAEQPPPEDAQPNAADPKALKEQQRGARRRKDETDLFWRRVFADPVGRREMWRILQELHAFEERFAYGPVGFPDPLATWFDAGKQSFGMTLYHSWLLVDHEGVRLMHFEHDSRFPKPKRARKSET